ncbi:hypothetical protein YUYDRAFT_07401 [Streptomyces sp. ScaeMP-e48]|uniref:hypothetical protein n=1 Tax=Streptomyces TaxID=1883 RepID=UPI00082377EF|nr:MULTISPECIES: hypothetical protein [Streptomyces]SCK55838.1 hypothetical protein YUYDRAFT_07401 [Streptomyces sp. ScaeMP-e48]
MNDGIAWLDDELGRNGYALTMVKGISPESLAVYLGARPGTLVDPATTPGALEFFHGPGSSKLPDWAMVGQAADGWAFALETPETGHRDEGLAPEETSGRATRSWTSSTPPWTRRTSR